MSDDELRRLIGEAHRDDAPPPFDRLTQRPPRRRRAWLLLAPAAVALAVLLMFVVHRPAPPPPSLFVDSRGPLDFLLQTPGAELLRDTPHFDPEGAVP